MSDGPIGGQLILQLVLILVNAFFAASEMAVISLNENKLRYMAGEGDKASLRMMKMVQDPSKFLSTIQVAITLAGYLGAAFAADNFAGRLVYWLTETIGVTAISASTLNTLSLILITIILSYLTLVIGELVPKRIAMKNPEKVARMCSGIVLGLSTILKPVVWLLSKSTNGVLRLLGIDPNSKDSSVSEEEIMMMVDMSNESGMIDENERELIENIFDFNDVTADEVMTHRTDMVVIWIEDSEEEIIETISSSGLSRFPVCGEDIDDVVGVLRTREYLLSRCSGKKRKSITELVTPAYFVPETVKADILFRQMQSDKQHMAIVVDEYGGTSGLVTMEDLLEEIFGNIYDESDPFIEQDITQLGDNLWRIAGITEMSAVAEALKLDWDEDGDEEYETLGGLVFSCLTQIPTNEAKPIVDAMGLHIEVQSVAERRIEWALVSKIIDKPAEIADTKEANGD